MDSSNLDELVNYSHFIDGSLKEECKRYFKQVHEELGGWFYSYSIQPDIYQGDVIDRVDVIYYELKEDSQELQETEDVPCMILSHTCDIDVEDKTRRPLISLAPIFNYEEFAENKTPEYSEEGWKDFLEHVRTNRITDILYIPKKEPLDASIVLLDRIFSIDPLILQIKLSKNTAKRILSLSQIGFYYFLIKLTYHFARYEDRSEIVRE